MKSFKRLTMVVALMLVVAATALAGDMPGTGGADPATSSNSTTSIVVTLLNLILP